MVTHNQVAKSGMTSRKTIRINEDKVPLCADHDIDCVDVLDKVKCWLYAPEEGRCPYLEDAASGS